MVAHRAGVGFTLASGTPIDYWVQERVKSGSTITKRNFAPSSAKVTLIGDGTNDKPVVTRPAYSLEPGPEHPANAWCYVCTDKSYGLESLPAAMRRNVRRGTESLRIEPISMS